MNYYRNINEYQGDKSLAIAIGKFDGLHKGHQYLIDRMLELAEENLETMLISFQMESYFENHGIDYEVILSQEEKYEKLNHEYKHLLDHVLMCPFTEDISQMDPESFAKKILVDTLHCKHIIVGEGFRFGKGASGDTWKLEQLGEVYNFEVHILKKEMFKDEVLSSTAIKTFIQKGEMRDVSEVLACPYSITNTVVHGAKLGRTIGFPTLNLPIEGKKVLPPRGVYGCKIHMDNEVYYGVGNLGRKPTVSDISIDLLEVHVFDFDGDAYGEKVKVELLDFYRAEEKFSNIEALTQQLHKDAKEVKEKFTL